MHHVEPEKFQGNEDPPTCGRDQPGVLARVLCGSASEITSASNPTLLRLGRISERLQSRNNVSDATMWEESVAFVAPYIHESRRVVAARAAAAIGTTSRRTKLALSAATQSSRSPCNADSRLCQTRRVSDEDTSASVGGSSQRCRENVGHGTHRNDPGDGARGPDGELGGGEAEGEEAAAGLASSLLRRFYIACNGSRSRAVAFILRVGMSML